MRLDYDTARFLKTLRRIPPEIRAAMATRAFELSEGNSCLVGWAVREGLAYANGKAAEEYAADETEVTVVHRHPDGREEVADTEFRECDPVLEAMRLFGGSEGEWASLYFHAADDPDNAGDARYDGDEPSLVDPTETTECPRNHRGKYPSVELAFTLAVTEAVEHL